MVVEERHTQFVHVDRLCLVLPLRQFANARLPGTWQLEDADVTKTFKIDARLSLARVCYVAFPASADPVFKGAFRRRKRGRVELE